MLAQTLTPPTEPNGQYRVQPERQEIIEFMSGLSVRKVPGIGRVTERILEALEVKVRIQEQLTWSIEPQADSHTLCRLAATSGRSAYSCTSRSRRFSSRRS